MDAFIRGLPKAELHLHVEGTLEPELLFELGRRNELELPWSSVDALRAAYDFDDLQSFLDLYYQGAAVLQTAQDFDDLAAAYLRRARAEGVRHAEIFFDPQTHTVRGVPFATVFEGLDRALERARGEGASVGLILCFLRHLSEDAAFETLEQALPYRDRIVAVGLDSSEVGHPPEKFARVFARARDEGFRVVAHAGEEGPPAYIWQALDVLGAERIDHGVRALEDPELVKRLAADQVPLTVCPLSNVCLGVYDAIEDHDLKRLLDAGLKASVHSDDPAYFGGYIADNYVAVHRALGLSRDELVTLARNGFEAAFIPAGERQPLLDAVDRHAAA